MYIHITRKNLEDGPWVCYKCTNAYMAKYSDGTPMLYIRFDGAKDIPQTGRTVLFYEGLKRDGDTYVNNDGDIVAIMREE